MRSMALSDVVLQSHGLTVGYGQVPAVVDLDLEVRSGEIVGLLGANGAGKTTTLLGLAGVLAPMNGHVEMFGERTKAPLHRRARLGLALVPEQRSIFRRITAEANLKLGLGPVEEAIAFAPELANRLNVRAGLLSGGEQQILVLARALAAKPRVLLVDELSLGLAPVVVKRMMGLLEAAAADGTGVIVVEQGIHNVLRIANRAYVLRRGQVVFQGDADFMRAHLHEIRAAYLTDSTEEQPTAG
jgi:branched-chain amino acid transport system ATP-binding protein